MKVGDYVTCINDSNESYCSLRVGHRYKIVAINDVDLFNVVDINGYIHCSYRNWRFELDIRYMRRKKLKKLTKIVAT